MDEVLTTTATLWNHVRHGDLSAALEAAPQTAFDACYLAIIAWSHGEPERAARLMRHAAQSEPGHQVFSAAATYLEQVLHGGTHDVYASGDAFAAFVRGGGNIPLYRAVSSTLKQIYQQGRHVRLLDVGVGDGLALLPALTDEIVALTLVEPSTAILAKTEAGLHALSMPVETFPETLQSFTQHARGEWDIAQATFSLHSLPFEERPGLLRWLRDHTRRLLIAEFDVPVFEHVYAPAHVHSVIERYRIGLGEYGDDRMLVAQGFLMPVMLGYFDPTRRVTYEQPVSAWVEQLRTAGFQDIKTRLLYGYWWAPAFLIDGHSVPDA